MSYTWIAVFRGASADRAGRAAGLNITRATRAAVFVAVKSCVVAGDGSGGRAMAEAVTPQASFISGKAAWLPGGTRGRVTSYRFDIALALSEHQGKESIAYEDIYDSTICFK